MEMLPFVRNSMLLGALFGVLAGDAMATIVVETGGVETVPEPPRARMRTVVLLPNSTYQSGSSGVLQRDLDWRSVGAMDSRHGIVVAIPPAASVSVQTTAARQVSLRNNIGRANAYRLNYFRR